MLTKAVVMVIGLGEVGGSLFELIRESGRFEVYAWDINKKMMRGIQQEPLPKKADVLHICYGCQDQESFVKTTIEYIDQFRPELTIINSTVPPRTTEKVHRLSKGYLVHSPIRGMHKTKATMKKYLLFLTKYIGGVDCESTNLARNHFEEIGLKTNSYRSPLETELAKLFETTYRAWMIACFQEMHRISRHFSADFIEVVDFLEDTHLVRFDRPIMFPDVIGGHCLIPNAKLLLNSFNSRFIKLILESNKKRKEEIKDRHVTNEVERVKKKVELLDAKLSRLSF